MIIDPQIISGLEAHKKSWKALLNEHQLENVGVATTLSIKVADKRALFEMLEVNAGNIEQVHIGTVNERYIASAALKTPAHELPILKILERRAGSSDPLGLDSIDYLVKDIEETYEQLVVAGLPVEKESNDVHAWLSLRFGDKQQFEAKFTDHLVLEVAVKEMKMTISQLLSTL